MKCVVVIPVGPGHEEIVHRAINTVAMARRYGSGPFMDIDICAADDTLGKNGRSKTRNEAVAGCTDADWLFFLDADDLMHPEAFSVMHGLVDSRDAVWGTIMEYVNGLMLPRFQMPEIRTYPELVMEDPYQSIQMGHFVRREVALANPFNEEMDTGEDWDYYLRVWKNHQCVKIDVPLMVNHRGIHSGGERAATGADWRAVVDPMLQKARGELVQGDAPLAGSH